MVFTPSAHKKPEHAEVLLFPPVVGLILFIAGVALQMLVPLRISSSSVVGLIAGIIILAGGIGLQLTCLRMFKKARTTPLFQNPTANIVESGPYARSRNPIYIAVFIQFMGLALLINTWWLIIFMPILYLYLRFGVIAREEQYLEQRFGAEYRTYRSRVPRWL